MREICREDFYKFIAHRALRDARMKFAKASKFCEKFARKQIRAGGLDVLNFQV
jgi:hypothetical protein